MLLIAGCGGLSNSTGTGGSYAGLYRAGLTRGSSTVTVSVDTSGNAKMVITDDAGVLPSFTGTGTATTVNGTGTLNVNLTGTDGSTAVVTGAFGASGGTVNLTINISGGIGATGLVLNPVTVTTVYPGTWTGTQTYTYTTNQGTTKPATATMTYVIAADGATLTGSGSLVDPSGNAATAAISGTVDPSGLYTQTTTYSYTGSNTTIAVTYSGFLNVDFATGATIRGSQSGTWPNAGPKENDTISFTKATGAAHPKSPSKKQ